MKIDMNKKMKIVIPEIDLKRYYGIAKTLIDKNLDGVITNVDINDYNNDDDRIMFWIGNAFIGRVPKSWLLEIEEDK